MEAKAGKHPASSEDYLETRVTGGKILEGSSSLMGGDKLACQVIFCLCPGHEVNDMIEDKCFRRECRKPDISPISFPLSPQRLTATNHHYSTETGFPQRPSPNKCQCDLALDFTLCHLLETPPSAFTNLSGLLLLLRFHHGVF